MKLYYAPGACSLSLHIVLREAGFDFDIERVDLRTGRTAAGVDFRSVNPKGYVPALELDDGEVLTETAAIQQYLADLKPEARLAPAPGTRARFRVNEWLTFVSSELHAGFEPLFNPDLPEAALGIARERLATRLDYLNDRLKDRAHLWGEAFTIADAYCYTVLGWSRLVDVDLGRWPELARYTAAIEARPSVRRALRAEADTSRAGEDG